MRVKNINGTGGHICKCGSWLEHWKKFSGKQLPNHCPVYWCAKPPSVGAHVQKDNSGDNSWYIVPFCDKHNAENGKTLDILNIVDLVPANVIETCDNDKADQK